MSEESVFRLEGGIIRPSGLSAGPWNPSFQHGGGPASLFAWGAEALPTRTPMRVSRLTIDLLRPVPVAELELKSVVVREGTKIQLCALSLHHNGKEVARASALKIRVTEGQAREPYSAIADEAPLDHPLFDQLETDLRTKGRSDFQKVVERRNAKGGFGEPGPGATWFRIKKPLIEGVPTSALMRAAVTSDFCNATSSVVDVESWSFINGDISLSLTRDPVGDWILLNAETWVGPDGVALAAGKLADERGYFGRAWQCLVMDPVAG